MKNLLIFCIVCSLGVVTILARPSRKTKEKHVVMDCAEELNLDGETYFQNPQLYTIDDQTCMTACIARKYAVDELIGSSNKETFYNLIMKVIDEDYKEGFESSNFTRKDIVGKIENCYAAEHTECGFYACFHNEKLFSELFS